MIDSSLRYIVPPAKLGETISITREHKSALILGSDIGYAFVNCSITTRAEEEHKGSKLGKDQGSIRVACGGSRCTSSLEYRPVRTIK